MDKTDSTTEDDLESSLELQEMVVAELSASVSEVDNGATTRDLNEVSQRLALAS